MRGTVGFASPNGVPLPIGDTDGAEAVAGWLGGDLQYSIESVDRWLETCAGLANGQVESGYQGTGNAFSVSATTTVVLLESEYVESQQVCITLGQLTAALREYKEFVERYTEPGFVPTSFGIEYLAEGEAARALYAERGGR